MLGFLWTTFGMTAWAGSIYLEGTRRRISAQRCEPADVKPCRPRPNAFRHRSAPSRNARVPVIKPHTGDAPMARCSRLRISRAACDIALLRLGVRLSAGSPAAHQGFGIRADIVAEAEAERISANRGKAGRVAAECAAQAASMPSSRCRIRNSASATMPSISSLQVGMSWINPATRPQLQAPESMSPSSITFG